MEDSRFERDWQVLPHQRHEELLIERQYEPPIGLAAYILWKACLFSMHLNKISRVFVLEVLFISLSYCTTAYADACNVPCPHATNPTEASSETDLAQNAEQKPDLAFCSNTYVRLKAVTDVSAWCASICTVERGDQANCLKECPAMARYETGSIQAQLEKYCDSHSPDE